jgi:ADP-heptose:LPS heptosyltransferase
MPLGKILVIRGGAIGDFILTLPALAALRERFPEVQVELLGYPHIASLAAAGGLVARVQSIEARALAGFFARNGTLDPALTEYFAGFALVISYLYDPDEIFKANLGRSSKAQYLQGPHRPEERSFTHATDLFLKPLEQLAVFDADPVPRLNLVNQMPTSQSGQPSLALHPGSGSERKNWPASKWAALLERLIAGTDWRIVLVGGEAEGERLQELSRLAPPDRLEVFQSRPLVEVAARLRTCSLFVGHDSGISHLAAALGLPGLVLWGSTNLQVWRPRSDRFSVLQHDSGLAQLPVGTVFAHLQAMQANL